jgi:hypothetical protein
MTTRRHHGLVIIAAYLALSCVTALAREQASKPVLEQETFHAVPGSFREMWQVADVVAKVRITRSIVRPTDSSPVPRIETLHRATVLAVFKGEVKAHSEVSFTQVAGQLETATAIVRVADEEPLAPGDYVVFLRRTPLDPQLRLVGDVDGAYKVNNGFIEPQGRFTSFAKEHRGLSERRFVAEITAIGHRLEKER